jgi:hypothetical protein
MLGSRRHNPTEDKILFIFTCHFLLDYLLAWDATFVRLDLSVKRAKLTSSISSRWLGCLGSTF